VSDFFVFFHVSFFFISIYLFSFHSFFLISLIIFSFHSFFFISSVLSIMIIVFQCRQKMIINVCQKFFKKNSKNSHEQHRQQNERNDMNIYAKFYKNEFKTTTYLRFKNVTKYKKFRFNVVVFIWFLRYYKYFQSRNVKVSFTFLRDLSDLNFIFSFNFKDLLLKYFIAEKKNRFNRKINNAHKNYIYVEILYHFVKKIKNSKISYNLNSTVQKNATKKFEQTFERITFICSISSFDAVTIQFSKLDSLKKFDECILKRYNKANIILKFFQFVVTSTKWKKIFEIKALFKTIMISSNVISTWMRFSKIKDDTKTMNAFRQINARSFKTFLLKLNRKTRSKTNLNLTKHIKNHIKFNSLRLSKIIIKTNRDSREYFLNEMWRNAFKRQLKLINLYVDFLIMKMSSKFFDELLIYDLKNMSTMISWIKIQKYLFNVNVTKFVFVYILHVVNERNFDFEYTNFLLIIQDDIELIMNKNIVEKSLKMNSIKIANDKNIDHKKLFVFKLNQFLNEFLFDRHIVFCMKSISKIIFITVQHEKMLKYHDNFNVFTVDDLLRY
jgi:hypothetical protein